MTATGRQQSSTRLVDASPGASGSARTPTSPPAGGASGAARTRPPGHRPTWAQIDLDAITANVAALKVQARAPLLMAVVKADGYGHGMVPAARAALRGGADWLAVALVEEGRQLRDAGVAAPVLVFTEPPAGAVPAMLDAGLVPTVYTPAFTGALDTAGRERDDPVAVHLLLDTGMRRAGVPQADWDDALRRVRDAPGLRMQGLWSHLAVADEPADPFTDHQAAEFRRGLRLARSLGAAPEIAHLCNSAGTLDRHDDHHDLVRPGLSIFGLEPAPGIAAPTVLRPAMSWYSRLSLVKRLAAGEAVSYGLRWAPDRETTLGTVPAGYADGVSRLLSNVGRVLVAGRRAPVVGSVTMDQFLVDAGDAAVGVGDEVCLLGEQGDQRVTADDWARWLSTINYEVVSTVGRRVPRVYLGTP